MCVSERGRAVAELERPVPRPGRLPGRHHQHPLPAQINGRVFGTAGGRRRSLTQPLIYCTGSGTFLQAQNALWSFFLLFFLFLWRVLLFVLFLHCICCILVFFCLFWEEFHVASEWSLCRSRGMLRGRNACASLDLWSCEAQSVGRLFLFLEISFYFWPTWRPGYSENLWRVNRCVKKVCLDSGQFTNIDHSFTLNPVFTLARNRAIGDWYFGGIASTI